MRALLGLRVGVVAGALAGRWSRRAPFARAARGRGLTTRRVVGGLVAVEGAFGSPGVGNAILAAIAGRDRALLVGLTTVVITAVIVANAVADLAAAAAGEKTGKGTMWSSGQAPPP